MTQPLSSSIAAIATLTAMLMFALLTRAQPLRTGHEPPEPFRGLFQNPVWNQPVAAPESHSANFAYTHGIALHTDEADCASCHTETFCTDCHVGLTAPIAIHPPGFLSLHGPEALARANDCASCHTTTRFCAECHQQSDLTTVPGSAPPPGFQAHPPDWLDATSAWSHGPEARANLLSCMSCHSGTDCADCHVTVNPHGPGFERQCRALLDSGSPVCADCHSGQATLPLELLAGHPSCQR